MSAKDDSLAQTEKPTGPPPKKRRSAPNLQEASTSAKRARPEDQKNEFEEVMAKIKEIGGSDSVKYAKKLKAMLANSAKIGSFVSHRRNLETLVAIFAKETTLLGTSMYNEELHKYSISIIANCCFTDKTASTGMQIRRAQRTFLDLTVRIFESTTSNIDIRVATCRLIGNLCNNKELVTNWLSTNSILFDRIALLLESSNESIVTQCLRIFGFLANHSFTRVIMLSNGGFYLGKLLAKLERRDEVVKILRVLLKRHMHVLDRQLSSSACSEHVVEMFFETGSGKNQKNHRQFVIDLFSSSTCIREQMETENFIERLLTSELAEKNRMLAAFSQSAWGRAKLRTSGALDVLVEVFADSAKIDEKLAIVAAFRHFVHDTAGVRHLSENQTFVNTIVRDVNAYVEENRSECEPAVDVEFVQNLRRRTSGANHDGERANQNVEAPEVRLHKDFYSMWSYDTPQTSPRRAHSASMSPPYSPQSSGSFPSSVASSAASSPAARRHSEGILDELSDVESGDEEEHVKGAEEHDETEKRRKQGKTIVEGELWLLTWLAHDDYNLQFLIRPDVVDCVVAYLRCTANPDFRTYRVLRRMATHRTHVYRLLDLQFHVRILTGMCASPCRMLKYAKSCKQCDTCSEHGREILREFASHVDNSYGDAHINSQFTKEDFVNRTKAAIAKIVLVKERIRLAKVPALTELFNSLAHVMSSPENFQDLGKATTYENGPSLSSQIIGALSVLISGQKIKELCENDMWYFPPEGTCQLESPDEHEELIHFVDETDGQEIAAAPMSKICSNSHYFEGMYSSDFVEKTAGIRTFQVASDACSKDEFRLFIHLLASCSASCATVSSAEQCAALLALSDQFLCPHISTQVCADDGPLRTFLNGRSLHLLLPVALATNAHPTLLDTVFLTLVRFSSSDDVTRALEAICENSTVVNTFVTSLRTFLTTKC